MVWSQIPAVLIRGTLQWQRKSTALTADAGAGSQSGYEWEMGRVQRGKAEAQSKVKG